jgi:uncharacterized sulfatase
LRTKKSFCRSPVIQGTQKRPNILFAISDDHSWPHTGAYGCKNVNTPAFDRVAEEGALFHNFFCAAPQCSPNRAAILTGRHIGQLEEAGTHASNFPRKFKVYTDILEEAGYETGFTGKGWGPGNWEFNCRPRNPAGPEYSQIRLEDPPSRAIRNLDYAGNFQSFFEGKDPSKPFCFWYGSSEPHRVYETGSGLKAGKRIEDVRVPPFLPDTTEIRSDMLDYFLEIEWFDQHLERILDLLERAGELDNTIVVVTGDNGMPFPGAKANLFEYGTHVPLAVRWPEEIQSGMEIEALVSSVDLAPTYLEAAGLEKLEQMTGVSMLSLFRSSNEQREFVISGRERHSHSRPDNLGYPSRAIRNRDYLLIRNFHPERWPMGDPTGSGEPFGFHDIDNSPSKTFLLENKGKPALRPFYQRAFEKRPGVELYDIQKDPGCMDNLAGRSEFSNIENQLWAQLEGCLKEQNDPRAYGYEIFESYPRYNRMRAFPGFRAPGQYNFNFH